MRDDPRKVDGAGDAEPRGPLRSAVVEDERITLVLIEEALRGRGHLVSTFENAETALAMHQEQPFDLMVLDWMLPGMNGLELCRRVRSAPAGVDVAVLVVTGRSRRQDLEEVLRAGASDYLAKPVDLNEFLTRIAVAEHWLVEACRRKQAEAALKRTEEGLLLADRMASLGTLAAGIAHEINNPLAYVSANLGYLDDELSVARAFSPEQLGELRTVLAETRRGIARVEKIVRDLRTYSRPNQATLTAVDVHQVIATAINLVGRQLQGPVDVRRRLGEVPPTLSDEARLCQVLLNLLVNAAQAIAEKESGSGTIDVVTESVDGQVIIEIRDDGVGMTTETQRRIFDPFFTTKPVGVGTGLGLSISRSLVRALKGDITVESAPGAGARFRVCLPVATPGLLAEEPTRPPSETVEHSLSVLLVDDDAQTIAELRGALRHCQVASANSGREALQFCREASFDLILCELAMTEQSGLELVRELHQIRPDLARRLVLMTDSLSPEVMDALHDSARPWVEKPLDAQTIRRLLDAYHPESPS